jgi:hypothetical protein
MNDKYRNAWPNKQYDGNLRTFREYVSDMKAWLIDNNFDRLDSIDPATIPRVLVAYDDADGNQVPAETQANYTRRINADKALNKSIWAKAIRGFTNYARETADAAGEEDSRLLFAAIKEEYGIKSSKQVTTLVRSLNTTTKKHDQPIEQFNSEWRNVVKSMKDNGMNFEEPYLINLYLISLGDSYSTLESMVAVMPEDKRTLINIMKLAIDHNHVKKRKYEEVNNSGVAMTASNDVDEQATYKKRHKVQDDNFNTNLPCSICKHRFHCSSECFDGGLRHFTSIQKREWIAKKAKERQQRYSNNNNQDKEQAQATKEQAYAALEEKVNALTELNKRLKKSHEAHGIELDSDDGF